MEIFARLHCMFIFRVVHMISQNTTVVFAQLQMSLPVKNPATRSIVFSMASTTRATINSFKFFFAVANFCSLASAISISDCLQRDILFNFRFWWEKMHLFATTARKKSNIFLKASLVLPPADSAWLSCKYINRSVDISFTLKTSQFFMAWDFASKFLSLEKYRKIFGIKVSELA